MRTIVRAKGGSKERIVEVDKIQIPDLWKIVHNHNIDLEARYKEQILETWSIAHDLLRAVRQAPDP